MMSRDKMPHLEKRRCFAVVTHIRTANVMSEPQY